MLLDRNQKKIRAHRAIFISLCQEKYGRLTDYLYQLMKEPNAKKMHVGSLKQFKSF